MRRYLRVLFPLVLALAVLSQPSASAAAPQRLALVIGNASYEVHALATPANDAALIARTLQAAGFHVVRANDLKQDALRTAFGDFTEMLRKAGPDTVAVVYFAGYGLQLEGENYLLPVDARIAEASDVPRNGVQLSDLMHMLAKLQLKAAILILDAARKSPFLLAGVPPSGGLAWLEPAANTLVAFNAAPGTISSDEAGGYGPYARAIAEMIRQGGLTPAEVFLLARLRVNGLTRGAQVPWDASGFQRQFPLVERRADAPQSPYSLGRVAWMRSQVMGGLASHDAYFAALIRDTFDAYADFLADHGRDPMARRVRALLAARREAITWWRSCQANVPDAYWTYLDRYPSGPHGVDARRRLQKLEASLVPPAKFRRVEYDVPPPLPGELDYVGRPALSLADPEFSSEPAPSPHDILGDPPDFPAPPAAAPSTANALPTARPVPPPRPAAPSSAGAPESSLAFGPAQMRPSIDDLPVRPDRQAGPSPASAVDHGTNLTQPSSAAARAALTNERGRGPAQAPSEQAPSEEAGSSAARTSPDGRPASIALPFWANLDPARVAPTTTGAGALPGLPALPAWASWKPVAPDRIVPPVSEPLSTGALGDTAPAFSAPTGLALRGRRWFMLTPEASIPLPVSRPIRFARPPYFGPTKPAVPSVPTSSPSQAPQQPIPRAASTRPAAGAAAPKPQLAPASSSKPTTARAGSPAGISSAATTGSR